MIELGGNIQLVGFRDLDNSEIVVLKKIIGSYARKYSDQLQKNYEGLTITMKKSSSKNFEVHAKLMVSGNPLNSNEIKTNLYVAVAGVLKNIETQANKIN